MQYKALTANRFSEVSLGTKVDYLDESKWFREFSFDEIKDIAQFFDVYVVPPNETLCEEGSSESFLGLIVSGSVGIFKKNAEGAVGKIAEIGSGKVFGEMSLVDGRPRSAEVKVLQKLEVCVMKKEKFQSLVQVAPALGVKLVLQIAQLISARLRKTSGQLVEHLGSS